MTAGGIAASLLLAFFALLTLKRFDSIILWKLTIVATEMGHVIGLLGIGIAAMLLTFGVAGLAPAALSLLSTWILFRPSLVAFRISRTLPYRLEKAYGRSTKAVPQFAFLRLFTPSLSVPRPLRLTARAEDGRALRVDLYNPASSVASPVVIVIHGGGWNNGDAAQLPSLNGHLVRWGYAVAAVSYGLAPAHVWPVQRSDILSCIRFLRSLASEHHLDPNRMVVLGRSAGGQLATHVAYTANDPGIKGVVSLYAPQDLSFAYRYAPPDDLIHSRRLLEEYVGGPLDAITETYREASPYEHARAGLPPTLLIHGTHDLLTWHLQSLRLHRKLTTAGAHSMYLQLSWATHGFDFFLNGPAGQLAVSAILGFLAATVPPAPGKP